MAQKKASGGRPADQGWLAAAGWLKANPGKWALVASGVHPTTGTAVKSGRLAAFRPHGAFEARLRNCRPNTADLYVRYNPKENA
jgi:hypothetical protein